MIGQAAEVAGVELAVDFAEGEADAVTIGKGWGWVQLEFGQREAGGIEECAEPAGFFAELSRVGKVLELASAA